MAKALSSKEIADILEQIAIILQIKGENPFKSRAYSNAAKLISQLDNLPELVEKGELSMIRGIGDALSKKISELLITGELKYFNDLKASVCEDHLKMLGIRGLGPRKIHLLHELLGIKTIEELESACKENRLLDIRGFGKKIQDKILNGIEHVRSHLDYHLYSEALHDAESILKYLQSCEDILGSPCLAGSARRKCELIRDLDFLVSTDNLSAVAEYFLSYSRNEKTLEKGNTKIRILLNSGLQADLRLVREDEFPFALHHFTGSKEHNAALRRRARKMGMVMNEYGISTSGKNIRCVNEEEIFGTLGLSYIPPELRENTGEIEEASVGNLPNLIKPEDIKGVFHVHTNYSDGSDSIEAIAHAAKRTGLQYVGISDHSRSAFYAHGLSTEDVIRQHEEIDALNKADIGICIFKGIEVEILPDGELDYDYSILERFDFIIAAVHSHFSMPELQMTDRIIKALEHPMVTMLAHPTGRLLLSREPYKIDMSRILNTAAVHRKVLELNSNPHRLDIDWRCCKQAKKKGVMIAVNPDAHHASGLHDVRYGIDQARKGWIEASDCLNTLSLERVRSIFWKKYF